jgi:hypothetical protein
MVRDCEYGVIPLRYWEFGYEVDCYSFERRSFRFSPDGLKRRLGGVVVNLMSLAFGAPLYIVRYFLA